MKHIFLISFLILFISFNVHCQESAELQKLKNAVFERIKMDLKDQDTSYYLFPLKIDNSVKRINSKMPLIDSANFVYSPKSYLRFYLVCSGDSGNVARLRLYYRSGLSSTPDKLINEITCNSKESKIVSFDYYLQENGRFFIKLILDKDLPATAFAFGTNYMPRH